MKTCACTYMVIYEYGVSRVSAIRTLDGNNGEDGDDADETGKPGFYVEIIGDDQGCKRGRPHVMNKYGDEIKSVDIVCHEIDYFSRSSFAQCRCAQT